MNDKSFEDIMVDIILKGIPFLLAAIFFGGFLMHMGYQSHKTDLSNINIKDVHKLPEFSWNVPAYIQLHSFLDLIYEDTEGKKLLNALVKNNVHIRITIWDTCYHPGYNKIMVRMFFLHEATNIKRGFIRNNRYMNLLEEFMPLIHEMGHAIMDEQVEEHSQNKIYKTYFNSKEEELSATIMGLNIASRIYRKRDLTIEEAAAYLDSYCGGISGSAIHSSLPAYNNYINALYYRHGIVVPYKELIIQKIQEAKF